MNHVDLTKKESVSPLQRDTRKWKLRQ